MRERLPARKLAPVVFPTSMSRQRTVVLMIHMFAEFIVSGRALRSTWVGSPTDVQHLVAPEERVKPRKPGSVQLTTS